MLSSATDLDPSRSWFMRKARSTMVKRKKMIAKENSVETTSAPIALDGWHKEPEVRTDRRGIFIDKETGNLNIPPDLDMSFRNDEFNDFGIRLAGFTQSPTDRQYLESLSFNKFMRLLHNQAMYLNHMAGYLGSSTDSIMTVNKELDGDRKKAWYANDIALKRVKILGGEIDALKKTAAVSKMKAEEELKKTEDELAATVSANKNMLAEIEDLKIQLEKAKASSILDLFTSEIPARYEPSDKFYQLLIDLGQQGFEMLQQALLRHPSLDSAAKTIAESMDFAAIDQEEIDMEEEAEIDALKKTAAESKEKAEEESKKTEGLIEFLEEKNALHEEIEKLRVKIASNKTELEGMCREGIDFRKQVQDLKDALRSESEASKTKIEDLEKELSDLKIASSASVSSFEEAVKVFKGSEEYMLEIEDYGEHGFTLLKMALVKDGHVDKSLIDNFTYLDCCERVVNNML